MAVDGQGPGCHFFQSGKQAGKGGFTDAVFTQDGDDFPGRKLSLIGIEKQGPGFIAEGQIVNLDIPVTNIRRVGKVWCRVPHPGMPQSVCPPNALIVQHGEIPCLDDASM